jgi:hypothetical protein
MIKQRRQFDINLKLEVVRIIKEQGLTTTQIKVSGHRLSGTRH